MTLAEVPPQATRTHVNLRRLLQRCESYPITELQTDSDRRRFRSNVDQIDVLIRELEEQGFDDTSAISEYTQRANALKKLVDLDKLLSPIELSLSKSRMAMHTIGGQHDKLAQLERAVRLQRAVQDERRAELMASEKPPASVAMATPPLGSSAAEPSRAGDSDASSGLRQRRSGFGQQEDDANEVSLERHATIQEQMADDLLSMAAQLRQNTLAFSDALSKDSRVLRDAQSTLHNNSIRVDREVKRLSKYRLSSRSTAFTAWALLALAALAFAGVYMVIRLFPKSR
ncbi:SNAP receptor use1 [Sorochytrium milnesiophthora]